MPPYRAIFKTKTMVNFQNKNDAAHIARTKKSPGKLKNRRDLFQEPK